MNILQKHFPMIRTRENLLEIIKQTPTLFDTYKQWEEKEQQEFLDFCTGVKGVKLLYDSFFKEIMNPEYVPERMNEFLSLLLNQQVKVLAVLPNDSTRIADESSLLITDLVVELEDGTIANLEVQKIGYRFPGERSACYSADLLLRQYKRVRGEKGKKFTYKDIKTVYTIVLFEKSPESFKHFSQEYLHYFEQKSSTGLEMNLVQKYLFVPLDIFKKIRHDKGINGKLEAWLTFLGSDEPEDIVQLITEYPEFKAAYEEVYRLCLNVEKVIGIFSEELRELDHNTVQLMIDEMQQELDAKREELTGVKKELSVKSEELSAKSEELNAKSEELNAKSEELNAKSEELNTKNAELNAKEEELRMQAERIKELEEQLKQLKGK